nr:ribosomal RNA-processing protein 12 [Cryptococcus depauperatus CBS 7855]
MADSNLAAELDKIRRLGRSQLVHQSKPAQLLEAIESTIATTLASTPPYSSTAYFTSLLQCLVKACEDGVGDDEELAETENMGQGALIPATLYLFAMVVPETPTQVILSKLSHVLECILPLYECALEHPPALRSLLHITAGLIAVAPPQVLASSPLLRKAWNYLLEMNLDPRPKVRHLAQEEIRKILVTPIPPKLAPGNHPYLPRAREWVMAILQEEIKTGGSKSKKTRFADAEDAEGKRAIWVVQGLRGWVAVWGDEHLSALCSALLSLPPLPHLTSQIYSLLALLLTLPPADVTAPKPSVLSNLPTILESLLNSPPVASDMPTYLSAISTALIKMSLQDQSLLSSFLPKAFNLLFKEILLNPNAPQTALNAATDAISQGIIRYCISDDQILATLTYIRQGSHLAGARKKQKTPFLWKLIASLTDVMKTNALRLPYLFTILTALISRLRLRVLPGEPAQADAAGRAPTAAQELLLDYIKEVGDLRYEKGFEWRDKVDEVVGMSLEVIGVEGVLNVLPLNIEPDSLGIPPQPGRAYLLPLIRSHTSNSSLAYFTSVFRPLSERLFNRKMAAEEAGRAGEAKVWEVLVGQIWDSWPGFCEMPRDMTEGLTPEFLGLITNLLYSQPSLLPSLLRGLSQLVSSTEHLANSQNAAHQLRKEFGVDQSTALENLAVLKSLAKDMLSVLLNVFSKLPRESRGMVGEVIQLWVGIMTEQDVIETYQTVTTHLSNSLDDPTPAAEGASPVSHTMLDLLIIFTRYLPPTQLLALFTAASQPTMLSHRDATVQKKSYRLLKRLLEADKLDLSKAHLEQFVVKLGEAGSNVGPGAQRDRLQLLTALVNSLPGDSLSIIPELLSEAVLGTKEVNERARDAGYELLVEMGKKMAKGGVVVRPTPIVAGEEEEEMGAAGTIDASAEEYLTMVAAGLTGNTPHMISASLNSLSRLIFEFKDSISAQTTSELVSTLTVFLTSKNREIIKSALGFSKVAIVSLPVEALRPHLPGLVQGLLGWVHDHKNHFKSKTVHIFERLIRRFGFDEVFANAGDKHEERKVLQTIKKRKERAKKRKANRDEDDEKQGTPRQSNGNAFDDILYNSDSDLSSDEEEDERTRQSTKGKQQKVIKGRQQQSKRKMGEEAYIRNDQEEPMDLLSRSIASGVATTNPSTHSRKRKPGQFDSKFQTDKSGKLIIKEDNSDNKAGMTVDAKEGAIYLANSKSVDGAHRDSRGNLKFNRNTKRTREEEKKIFSMIDEEDGKKQKIQQRKQMRKKLGEEFKSKRGGGDIKRVDGPDPYSYVPLGQTSAKKGKKKTYNLTNKKKGSRR